MKMYLNPNLMLSIVERVNIHSCITVYTRKKLKIWKFEKVLNNFFSLWKTIKNFKEMQTKS